MSQLALSAGQELIIMALAAASSVELAGYKAADPDVDDSSGVLIDTADERRKSFASEGSEPQGEEDKWTSIFSSGQEDPQWARLERGIIHPHSRKYTIWSGVNAVLVAYWTFATWLIWGFIGRPSLALVVVQAVISCFFGLDIFVRFRVSYLDTKTLTWVQDPNKIAKRYLLRGFLFDALSILPIDLVFYIASSHSAEGYLGDWLRTLALLRMVRLTDTFNFFARFEKDGQSVYKSLKFFKLGMLVFLSAHIAACMLWFICRQEVRHSGDPTGCMFGATSEDWQQWPLYKKWVTSFYWSVLTVSSIGYGDYMPVTQFERLVVCAYEIFGLGVLSYCLGSMEVMLVRETDRTGRYHDKVRALNDYALRKSLPGALKGALKQHLVLEMAVDKVRPDVLNAFPHHLKAKVLRSQYKDLVARTALFHGTSPQFLDQVVGEMSLEIQLPNTAVVTAGDVAESLYVVVRGTLTRETAAGQPVAGGGALGAGGVFGKVAVLYAVPQVATVRTAEVCELLRVDKATLTRILRAYPEDNRHMLANMTRRAQAARSAGDGAQGLAVELSSVLEAQDAEVTRRLCNTAARGNAERLRELLVAPGASNGADYDGRAPLHFAAAAGHAGCVDVLAKAGADVNAQDHLGRTPLLEAVLGGHVECVAALRAAGAGLNLKEPGRTLCHVVATGATVSLAALLECGADPNATNYDGRTALHVAAVKGAEEAAQLLLHAGAGPHVAPKGVPSPREEAEAAGQTNLVRLFDQAGAGIAALSG
ncbi:K+-channel ERG and related proteins [Klebsormidium nitens]|uniref:K+-channel ERG and related proteins n=1 Tax=Klebsormidium nitens TaxID=105231 RepID=A0A1Y1I9T0_KLENI|nr:K+-channel ERG and related proteins [Klebsormidium nitens]|eukprot:GAQ87724.1 K+-channel ERG and related proteins [Klebsormidium nitens]